MKIDFDMLEKMVAAGASGAAILAAWRDHEEKKAPKRTKERVRQAAKRGNKRQQLATVGNIGQQLATVGNIEQQSPTPPKETPSQIAEREIYSLGKAHMGRNSGGLISSLVRHHNYDLAAARRVVDLAITKSDPREWVAASMRSKNGAGNSTMAAFDDLIARAEGGAVEGDYPMRDVTPGRAPGR